MHSACPEYMMYEEALWLRAGLHTSTDASEHVRVASVGLGMHFHVALSICRDPSGFKAHSADMGAFVQLSMRCAGVAL